jgi:hypothetical protein
MDSLGRKAWRGLLAATLILCVSGCGKDEGYLLTVHPTSGTVTRGGKPVAKAVVRFHPVDPKIVEVPKGETGPPIMLTSETDDAGHFVVSSYREGDGLPAGDYKVTVMLPNEVAALVNADPEASASDIADEARAKGIDPTKSAGQTGYSDPGKTPLKATIKDGDNVLELKMD